MRVDPRNRRRWERGWQYRRRRLSTAKKMLARAMKKSGHTYREISEALDISMGAINYILREEGPAAEKLTQEIGKRAVARYRLMSEHILSSIDDSDIYKAPLKHKVIAAAILADKAMMAERAATRAPEPAAPDTAISVSRSEHVSEHAEGPNFDNITVGFVDSRARE